MNTVIFPNANFSGNTNRCLSTNGSRQSASRFTTNFPEPVTTTYFGSSSVSSSGSRTTIEHVLDGLSGAIKDEKETGLTIMGLFPKEDKPDFWSVTTARDITIPGLESLQGPFNISVTEGQQPGDVCVRAQHKFRGKIGWSVTVGPENNIKKIEKLNNNGILAIVFDEETARTSLEAPEIQMLLKALETILLKANATETAPT